MAAKQTKKTPAKAAKAAKAPRAAKVVVPLTATEQAVVDKEMKRDDISNCAAIRAAAAKLKKTARSSLRDYLVSKHGIKEATANAQIQYGRSPAA